ncbi:hypothetical protein [Rhizobium sp. L1K21]|uniref:hypothetical protein n=1 Tax=Rhizobium sp. L1K21 TaxID=2954933 RepID=UPI002092DC88|nr:hypothetical protein [Rhizobium sp. L1K21]MCO6186323.1 hypothetical protein [Rhizobium sp. L1K21]
MARLLASYKKWLMTHALYALSKERNADDHVSGLRPGRLLDVMVQYGTVSRNTASAYLAELVAYKFLEIVDDRPDKRLKLLKPTQLAEAGMRRWYNSHLACLDDLDGGKRVVLSEKNPELIFLAQPRMIKRILDDEEWMRPPPSMAFFLDSDVGGLLIHFIITRLESLVAHEDHVRIGPLSTPALADMFNISASNIKRMFRKCEDMGLLGWDKPRRRGDFWISERFVRDHFQRQAIKFEMVDEAFHWAGQNGRVCCEAGMGASG